MVFGGLSCSGWPYAEFRFILNEPKGHKSAHQGWQWARSEYKGSTLRIGIGLFSSVVGCFGAQLLP